MAGVLAVLVHLVFIALLVFGLNWKDHPPEGMVVDIWTELPKPLQEPVKTKPPSKQTKPAQEPAKPEIKKPEPVKPDPPKPPQQQAAVTPPVKKPDIAMQQKPEPVKETKPDLEQQKKKEQERLKELDKQKELEKKKELEKQQELEKKKESEKQQELEKQKELALQKELEKQKEIQKQKELDAQRQREQAAKAQREAEAQRAAQQAAAARNQVTNEISKYKALILAKIRSRIVMPPDLPGNPIAEFSVTLLPGGDILDVRLSKSSGHVAFDNAVERAIFLSKPLPLPPDPALFNEFRSLNIKVHYRE